MDGESIESPVVHHHTSRYEVCTARERGGSLNCSSENCGRLARFTKAYLGILVSHTAAGKKKPCEESQGSEESS